MYRYRFLTNKIIIKAVVIPVLLSVLPGCAKLVEAPAPVTSVSSENVYATDATAAAVLTGVYITLSEFSFLTISTSSINSLGLIAGLSADELTMYGGAGNANTELVHYYLNTLTAGPANNSGSGSNWYPFYNGIYIVNLALERLAISQSLTPSVKQQLMGEAKFMRAFFYFYLVNLYGDVPLTTTSDYRVNAVLSRSSKTLVYQQVISDLKDAQNLLSDGYAAADVKTNTSERVRPNKWAATALLARAYLYTGDWVNAEAQATAVINNTSGYSLNTLNNVFLKNSDEAIWQLQPVTAGWNTGDATVFVLPDTGPNNSTVQGHPVYLSSQLLNSFEPGDQRKVNWVGSVTVNSNTYYYPNKYKSASLNAPPTEYLMVLRLGEQYLIRAEARVQQNNISGSQSDLNLIRTRAGLLSTTANDKTSLLAAILHERQVELFTEWGHRWLDLKRNGNVDAIMTVEAPAKGSTWSTNWQLYPIPLYEITNDPKLTQNPGY